MATSNRFKLILSMPFALALVACGIDQGGAPTPQQDVQSAAVTYGPIDGFGSVVLNGETIGTTSANVLVNGAQRVSLADTGYAPAGAASIASTATWVLAIAIRISPPSR